MPATLSPEGREAFSRLEEAVAIFEQVEGRRVFLEHQILSATEIPSSPRKQLLIEIANAILTDEIAPLLEAARAEYQGVVERYEALRRPHPDWPAVPEPSPQIPHPLQDPRVIPAESIEIGQVASNNPGMLTTEYLLNPQVTALELRIAQVLDLNQPFIPSAGAATTGFPYGFDDWPLVQQQRHLRRVSEGQPPQRPERKPLELRPVEETKAEDRRQIRRPSIARQLVETFPVAIAFEYAAQPAVQQLKQVAEAIQLRTIVQGLASGDRAMMTQMTPTDVRLLQDLLAQPASHPAIWALVHQRPPRELRSSLAEQQARQRLLLAIAPGIGLLHETPGLTQTLRSLIGEYRASLRETLPRLASSVSASWQQAGLLRLGVADPLLANLTGLARPLARPPKTSTARARLLGSTWSEWDDPLLMAQRNAVRYLVTVGDRKTGRWLLEHLERYLQEDAAPATDRSHLLPIILNVSDSPAFGRRASPADQALQNHALALFIRYGVMDHLLLGPDQLTAELAPRLPEAQRRLQTMAPERRRQILVAATPRPEALVAAVLNPVLPVTLRWSLGQFVLSEWLPPGLTFWPVSPLAQFLSLLPSESSRRVIADLARDDVRKATIVEHRVNYLSRKLQAGRVEIGGAMAWNYYALLGVLPSAAPSELSAAYRALARAFHPDLFPEDAQAAEEFQLINEAHAVLSASDKRGVHDANLLWAQVRPWSNPVVTVTVPGFAVPKALPQGPETGLEEPVVAEAPDIVVEIPTQPEAQGTLYRHASVEIPAGIRRLAAAEVVLPEDPVQAEVQLRSAGPADMIVLDERIVAEEAYAEWARIIATAALPRAIPVLRVTTGIMLAHLDPAEFSALVAAALQAPGRMLVIRDLRIDLLHRRLEIYL